MKKIKQPHGGAIMRPEKGDRLNPNGRPKQPRKLKEFIKELENEDDSLAFPFDLVEPVAKDKVNKDKALELWQQLQVFCKGITYKNSKGAKMFINAYSRAMNGDVRWAEFLVKMGFAGGFEPTKQETKVTDLSFNSQISVEIIKNYNENQNQSDTETDNGVGSAD